MHSERVKDEALRASADSDSDYPVADSRMSENGVVAEGDAENSESLVIQSIRL